MFGHLPEIFALLLVALLVFGPKRLVEMGSSFGKAFREFRDATREMSWSNLLSNEQPHQQAPTPQSLSDIRAAHERAAAEAKANPTVVEGSIERPAERAEEPPSA